LLLDHVEVVVPQVVIPVVDLVEVEVSAVRFSRSSIVLKPQAHFIVQDGLRPVELGFEVHQILGA